MRPLRFDMDLNAFRAIASASLFIVLLLANSIASGQSVLTGVVTYVDVGTPLPTGGVQLPTTPNETQTVHAATGLGFTFQNSCFAEAWAGDSNVAVDESTRVITVDFDESTIVLQPFCPTVFDPVSIARVDLDPLPAGAWRLEIDAIFDGLPVPLVSVIPAQTIDFTVVPAPAVPILSTRGLALLLLALATLAVTAGGMRSARS